MPEANMTTLEAAILRQAEAALDRVAGPGLRGRHGRDSTREHRQAEPVT